MKMKSFRALAMPMLLAASLTYVAPAIAEDTTNQATNPSVTDQNNASPSDNSSAPNSANPSNDGASSNNDNNSAPTNSTSDGNQEDAPTGDDDY